MHVTGIGALNVDKLFLVPRLARAGEELFIKKVERAPGGSAANTIAGLARLGVETSFAGCVGKDEDGDFLIESFEKEGVYTGCISRVSEPTGFVIALVDESGERTMYVYPGANDRFNVTPEVVKCIERADLLHLSSFVGDAGFFAQIEIADNLNEKKISFSPGMLYAKRCLIELKEIFSRSRVVFLNEEEAFEITGNRLERAARVILRLGAEIVVITLGEEGCYIATNSQEFRVRAEKARVVDTTGAGDAFAAGFIYGMLKGYNLEECGRIGNFVAARCIEEVGARAGLPTEEEVEEFVERLK